MKKWFSRLFCGSLKLERTSFLMVTPKMFRGVTIKNEFFPTSKIHKIAKNHFFHHKIFFLCVLSIIISRKNFPDLEVLNCAQKPFFYVKKLKKIDICPILGPPSKMKFFQLQSPTKWPKMIFSSKKKFRPGIMHTWTTKKIFQSGLTSGSAGLRKNMRDPPPTDTFWSSVLYILICSEFLNKSWQLIPGVCLNSKKKINFFLKWTSK